MKLSQLQEARYYRTKPTGTATTDILRQDMDISNAEDRNKIRAMLRKMLNAKSGRTDSQTCELKTKLPIEEIKQRLTDAFGEPTVKPNWTGLSETQYHWPIGPWNEEGTAFEDTYFGSIYLHTDPKNKFLKGWDRLYWYI